MREGHVNNSEMERGIRILELRHIGSPRHVRCIRKGGKVQVHVLCRRPWRMDAKRVTLIQMYTRTRVTVTRVMSVKSRGSMRKDTGHKIQNRRQ